TLSGFRARRRDSAKDGLQKRPLDGRWLESVESRRIPDDKIISSLGLAVLFSRDSRAVAEFSRSLRRHYVRTTPIGAYLIKTARFCFRPGWPAAGWADSDRALLGPCAEIGPRDLT